MPLIKSGSRAAASQNIREMIHAGHPQKQAIAAALRNQRQYKADGGGTDDGDSRSTLERLGDYIVPSWARPQPGDTLSSAMLRSAPMGAMFVRPSFGLSAAATPRPSPSSVSTELTSPGHGGFRAYQARRPPTPSNDPDYVEPPPSATVLQYRRRLPDDAGMAEGGAAERERGLTSLRSVRNTPTIRRILSEAQRRQALSITNAVPHPVGGDLPTSDEDRENYAGAPGFAFGGLAVPWVERAAARDASHEGMLHSPVPGRTDRLPISVSGGAYVLPADHVAHLGQGNSQAGAMILNKMFGLNAPGRISAPRMSLNMRVGRAAGGRANVPIIAAGGEYVIPPDKVREIGGGDLDHGHKILDAWVVRTRKHHIQTLRKLRPPKKN